MCVRIREIISPESIFHLIYVVYIIIMGRSLSSAHDAYRAERNDVVVEQRENDIYNDVRAMICNTISANFFLVYKTYY